MNSDRISTRYNMINRFFIIQKRKIVFFESPVGDNLKANSHFTFIHYMSR